MQLKDYQDAAIHELKDKLYTLWKAGHAPARLVFKAPTGAGKTVMVAELLSRISGDAQFDPDKAFVWLSFNPDSVEQSEVKLRTYLHGGVAGLYSTDQISARGKLRKNDVLFVNWQKLSARRAESRRLRQDGEAAISFDTFIKNTKADDREIIVIIDECHLARASDLSSEIIKLIAPRIELLVSATPLRDQLPLEEEVEKRTAAQVTINRPDVVASGILKRTVRLAPREEIEELIQPGRDLDYTLLDLATTKRLELADTYRRIGARVNPLVLIKLPNDDAASKAASTDDKLALVRRYLADLGIPDNKIAVWLTAKKENLAAITDNDSPIDYLIFKQAAATGWDCPRADVLVMFREIKSPVFETQIIGRILRTAEGRHYPGHPELDDAYLYTSYERDTVTKPPGHGPNTPSTAYAFRKRGVDNIQLPSVYIKRADYNDLGDTFQMTFTRVADAHFRIAKADSQKAALNKLSRAGLDLSLDTITNKIIVDAEIEVFDDFIKELARNADDLDLEASRLDVQKLLTNLLWKELALQDDRAAQFAPARSWSKLKSALLVYFGERLDIKNPPLYAVICNDLQKGARSALRPLISKALASYRPLRDAENARKEQSSRQEDPFTLLDSYTLPEGTPLFEIKGRPPKRYAFAPAYIPFDSDIERRFSAHLDSARIDWWFKNGNYGADFLAIPYIDATGTERLFYPDFIVRQGNRIGIFDTKSGLVAADAKFKAEALFRYIKANRSKHHLFGGIVTEHSGVWRIHDRATYDYSDPARWKAIDLH